MNMKTKQFITKKNSTPLSIENRDMKTGLLVSHDKGNTFKVIQSTLEELEYSIHYKVMDGKDYVPQHRERIMIVGFDKRRYHGNEKFEFHKLWFCIEWIQK